MMEQDGLCVFRQRGKVADKQVSINRVVPDVLGLKTEHAADFLGFVGAHIVQQRHHAEILDLALRVPAVRPRKAGDKKRHALAVLHQPRVDVIQRPLDQLCHIT